MDDLLKEIEAFREAHGITESNFGRLAAKDTKLVGQLKAGREVRRATASRIRHFMLTYGAEQPTAQAS